MCISPLPVPGGLGGVQQDRTAGLETTSPVRLWHVDLRAEPLPEGLATLDDDERSRLHRLRFEPDRRRFAQAHIALRRVLADALGLAPAAVRWRLGPHGKPRLDSDTLAFNLTHDDDSALIVVGPASHEWGVDLESVRSMPDADDVARRVFTLDEQAQLRATAPESRARAFAILWTRKEAVLKALGTGLSLEPASFDVGLDTPAVAPGLVRSVSPGATGRGVDVNWIDLDVGPDRAAALAWTAALPALA